MIGIVGTAREKLTVDHYAAMFHASVDFLEPYGKPSLISGGAAWSDHIAVSLFLHGKASSLTLCLPGPFNGRFQGKDGSIANHYHNLFSKEIGFSSLAGIQKAIDKGAIVTVHNSFRERNTQIAKRANILIAFGRGGVSPTTSGTLDTWNKCKGVLTYFDIDRLPVPDNRTQILGFGDPLVDQEAIFGFQGPTRYLSNFYHAPMKIGSRVWNTVENAYQAAKTSDRDLREKIRNASPSEAKKIGSQVEVRPEWDSIRVQVMRECLWAKFTQNGGLATRLLSTGEAYLEETNTWGDRFWGVCGGVGENTLGQLLMETRKRLREVSCL